MGIISMAHILPNVIEGLHVSCVALHLIASFVYFLTDFVKAPTT